MAGIRKSQLRRGGRLADFTAAGEEDYPFAIDPLPNLYFTRDPFASVGNGAVINKMFSVTRNRETIYADYIFKYHPEYKGQVKDLYGRHNHFHIEGGDVFNVDEKTLFVGISQRTTADAIQKLAMNLFFETEGNKIERIFAFNIPVSRAFMHLDTVFTMIDHDAFTYHPGITATLRVFELTKDEAKHDVKIEEHKGFVRGLEADMQTLAAHPLPAESFVGMEIRGDRLTDKENAGAALLDTCKEVKGKDPVQIGSYRGFTMSVAFDSMWKTYTLTLKGQMTHRVELGSDARGNLVRIENALDKMPERLRSVQEQLENLYNQQAAAKAEVGKPFPQEQELAAKTARLIELDMELNLDGKGQPQPEQAIAKSARPSVLDRLKAPPVHGAPEKPHKKEMEAR